MKYVEEEGKLIIKSWCNNPEEGALDQARNLAKLSFAFKQIVLLSDTHQGYGMPIGGVLASDGYVIPNAVGVDIGCFTGDTKVITITGKSYTLKNLAEKGESFYVFACNKDPKIVISKATAKLTRKNTELLAVKIDNGKMIKCTPDQKFLMRDNSYVRADKLQSGDSLMPLYMKKDGDGYLIVTQVGTIKGKSELWSSVQWLVASAKLLGKIPKYKNDQTIIHHKDGHPQNNIPSNLEFMSRSQHCSFHIRKRVKEGTHQFQTANKSNEFEEKRMLGVMAYCASEKGHTQKADTAYKNLIKGKAKFLESVKENGKRGSKTLLAHNKNPKNLKKFRAKKLYKCIFCGERIKSESFDSYHYQRRHKREVKEYSGEKFNHKVVSIKKLHKKEDVYCLIVPKYHNFALSAGVFVHNCGVCIAKTSLQELDKEKLKAMMSKIRNRIPLGKNRHQQKQAADLMPLFAGNEQIVMREFEKARHQMGTLGGGNHFIEIQKGDDGYIYIMIHSGSRNLGKQVADHYNKIAIGINEKYFSVVPKDWELAFLPMDIDEGKMYLDEMQYCVDFALANRKRMLNVIEEILQDLTWTSFDGEIINIAHNYARMENHFGRNVLVHRKGATSARDGEMGLIPGSQGTSSYIVKGKGNKESFMSCSHGAGRAMGRKAAERDLNLEEEQKKLDDKGIIHSVRTLKDLDEASGAYKDIDVVMAEQEDLVEIVCKLEPLAVIKG